MSVAALHVFFHILDGSRQCALLAGVLFATHPIHTEAVAGIVGRADLLCALFVFCALLAYIRAVQEDATFSTGYKVTTSFTNGIDTSRKSRGSPVHKTNPINLFGCNYLSHSANNCRRNGRIYLVLCALCTAIAMLCKEVGITALGLCSAYDVLVVSCGELGGGIFCVVPLGPHRQRCLRKNNCKLVNCYSTFVKLNDK